MPNKKYICEWCNSNFTLKHNLTNHQKNAKYCLKIQGRKKTELSCQWCKKVYSSSLTLKRHQKSYCLQKDILKYKKILEKRDKQIQNLKKLLKLEKEQNKVLNNNIYSLKENIANKKGLVEGVVKGIQIAPPTNKVTKNYINPKLLKITTDKIRPFTVQTIREDVRNNKYTEGMFRQGLKGLVKFIYGMVTLQSKDGSTIEQSYACTDVSRNRFHRFLDSKEWSEDNGAHFLKNVFKEIRKPVVTYYTTCLQERRDATNSIDRKYFDSVAKKTEVIYQGVLFEEGEDHDELFNKSRSKLKSMVSV